MAENLPNVSIPLNLYTESSFEKKQQKNTAFTHSNLLWEKHKTVIWQNLPWVKTFNIIQCHLPWKKYRMFNHRNLLWEKTYSIHPKKISHGNSTQHSSTEISYGKKNKFTYWNTISQGKYPMPLIFTYLWIDCKYPHVSLFPHNNIFKLFSIFLNQCRYSFNSHLPNPTSTHETLLL